MTKIRKIMSLALAFSMIISLLPSIQFAKAANPAPPPGYISDENNIMAYTTTTTYNGAFDIKGYGPSGGGGENWLSTTCGDVGYFFGYSVGAGAKISVLDESYIPVVKFTDGIYTDTTHNIRFKQVSTHINKGNYIKIAYEVTNMSQSSQIVSLGVGADVQIGNDDSAPITMFDDKTGFSMRNQYTNSQFNFYAKDAYGVTNVDAFWYGYYNYAYQDVLRQVTETSYAGDSGMTFAWKDRTIGAGKTQIFSVIVGIGPANKAPQLSNVTFTGGTEVCPAQTIQISGLVADTDYMQGTKIFCSIEGQPESEIYAFPGSTVGNFNGTYVIPSLSPGNYTLNVYAMDGAGGISNVETKNITIKAVSISAPTNQSVTYGSAANYSVTVSEQGATYQWQVSENNGTTWADIQGATSASYATPAVSESMQGYKYRCVAKVGTQTVTSSAATLTVTNIPQTISTTTNISKNVGDADFDLSATAKTPVTFTLKAGNDVVSLAGNRVHILKSGTAVITADAPSNTTYNAATPVDVTIIVNKQNATFPGGGVTLSSTYTPTLTLADITLPANYRWKDTTTVPKMGLSTYPVIYNPNSDIYNDVEGTANVTIHKAIPQTPTFPTASALTYGEKLVNSVLINGSGDGRFAWSNPEEIPTVTNNGYSVTFIPNDTEHYDYTGINLTQLVSLSVAKADPAYTVPTLSNVTYSPNLTLSTVVLPEGWTWDNGSTILVAGSGSYTLTFTPVDSANYNVVHKNISLTVDKAIPSVETPAPVPVTYRPNLKLSDIALGDGWSWDLPNTNLAVSSSGEYKATYTPTDSDNYLPLNHVAIPVTINKATPQAVVFPTASAITYGQALSESTLTGGLGDGTFRWVHGSIKPTVINGGYEVEFVPNDADNYDYSGVTFTKTIALSVNKADQEALSVLGVSNKTYGDASFDLSVSGGTTNGNVTYFSNNEKVVTINGNTVTIVGVGEASISAAMEGDDNYHQVTSSAVTLQVAPATPASISNATEKVKYGLTNVSEVVSSLESLVTSQYVSGQVASTTWRDVPTEFTQSGVMTAEITYTPEYGGGSSEVQVSYTVVMPKLSFTSEVASINAIDENNKTADSLLNYINKDNSLTVVWEDDAPIGTAPNYEIQDFQWSSQTYHQKGGTYHFETDYLGNHLTREVLVQPVTVEGPIAPAKTLVKIGADASDVTTTLKSKLTANTGYTVSYKNSDPVNYQSAGNYSIVASINYDPYYTFNNSPETIHVPYEVVNPSKLTYATPEILSIDATNDNNSSEQKLLTYTAASDNTLQATWPEGAIGATSLANKAPVWTALPQTYNEKGSTYTFSQTYLGNTISQKLTVQAVTVSKVTAPMAVTYPYGGSIPKLPETVQTILSNNSTVPMAVTWDTRAFNNKTNNKLSGTLTVPYGVTFPQNTTSIDCNVLMTLTYKADANGTITGITKQEGIALNGTGTTVTAVPKEGYHFIEWSDKVTNNPRTEQSIQANVDVTAIFAINNYKVNTAVTDNVGGTLTADKATVDHFGSVTLTAKPADGYEVASFTVNDVIQNLENNSYTIASVNGVINAKVTYRLKSFTVNCTSSDSEYKGTTTKADVVFHFTPIQGVVYQYSTNGIAWTDIAGTSYTASAPKDQIHANYCFRFKLSANNNIVSAVSNEFAVNIDNVSPTLGSVSPENMKTDVEANTVSFTLDEVVLKGSGYITIFNKDGSRFEQIAADNNRVKIKDQTVTVTLTNTMNPNSTYSVAVDKGFVCDIVHNPFAGISKENWSFSTKKSSQSLFINSIDVIVDNEPFKALVSKEDDSVFSIPVTPNGSGEHVIQILPNMSDPNCKVSIKMDSTVLKDNQFIVSDNTSSVTIDVVVEKSDGTMTTKTYTINILRGNVSSEVVNTSKQKVETPSLKGAVDVSEDLNNGVNVNLKLGIQEATVSNEDKDKLDNLLANNSIDEYVDINLTKIITDVNQTILTQEQVSDTQNTIKIRMELPERLRYAKSYTVLRMHNGQVDVLPATVVGNYIEFETDKFSMYVISGIPYTKSSATPTTTNKPVIIKKEHTAYIKGYADNTFRPDHLITRAETVAIIARVHSAFNEAQTYSAKFSDTQNNAWYQNYLGFASQNGLINGYSDGTFGPNRNITRAEFAVIIANYLGKKPGDLSTFKDLKGHWADAYIGALAKEGFITGYEDGTFQPQKNITRAEAVTMLNRALNRVPNREKLESSLSKYNVAFNDINKKHWAYYDILEASITHAIVDFH